MEISKEQLNEVLKYLDHFSGLVEGCCTESYISGFKNLVYQLEQILDSEH